VGIPGDQDAAVALAERLTLDQRSDGSVGGSPLRTAGTVLCLVDLDVPAGAVEEAAGFLLDLLEAQPGYARAVSVAPGELTQPCDLCGFFETYACRTDPAARRVGSAEMNALREIDPLIGPRAPVKAAATSARARVGPGSCYSWGLIPLAYITEALCRSGHADDPRLTPALNVLLGAQRRSGGWCRNPGGHPKCTLYAVRALAAHPDLRTGPQAEAALRCVARFPIRTFRFAYLDALARFEHPAAHSAMQHILSAVTRQQRPDGSFSGPCRVERAAAALLASRALGLPAPPEGNP
jgi:hypothetical protein